MKANLYGKKVCELAPPDYKIPIEMLENFVVFGKEHHSKWFDSQWEQQVNSSAPEISFDCIYENVWKPVISNCLSFLNRMYKKSLPLSDIKTLATQNLYSQLKPLCCAMQKCYKAEIFFSGPYEWIRQVIKHIEVYQKIVNNSRHIINALNFCLKLRESLQLKGDFSDITVVWKCVSTHNCIYVCTCFYDLYIQNISLHTKFAVH